MTLDSPSTEQVDTVCMLLDSLKSADYVHSVRAEMHASDGSMLITLMTDGAYQVAYFGRDGKIIGDWL